MIAICKRELRSLFSGMLGFSLCAAYLLVGGLYFWVYNLLNLYPDFGYTLYNTTFAMLVFISILTMRSLAEERRSHTDQLLLTAPVGVPAIILGKYLAMLAVFSVPVAVLGLCPLALGVFVLLAALAGLWAGLRARSLGLGLGVFLALAAALAALYGLGNADLTSAFSSLLGALCLFTPFEEFIYGLFSIPGLVYYLSVAALFLFLAGQGLEKRRWN